VATVRQRLRTRCGISDGAVVVVGVSGGADSLSLLIACAALRDTSSGIKDLTAVHVHHHLREQADADAAHVEQVAALLDVPVCIAHVHPADLPGNRAANARRLRYEALAGAADDVGADAVAVGHHAEDQLETMLMAMCRGSGLDGLSGMPWRRVLDGCSALLVRPLLATRKAECQSLCRAAEVTWCEDASNLDRSQARPRLRSEVLPVLESLWPDAAQHAAQAADVFDAVGTMVESHLSQVFGPVESRQWKRSTLRTLPAPLIAAGLRRAAIAAGAPPVSLGQRQLMPAAEAIADKTTHPRTFALGSACLLKLTVDHVELVDNQ
jgi:tRNA(Ile)-lysidine synthase